MAFYSPTDIKSVKLHQKLRLPRAKGAPIITSKNNVTVVVFQAYKKFKPSLATLRMEPNCSPLLVKLANPIQRKKVKTTNEKLDDGGQEAASAAFEKHSAKPFLVVICIRF